MNLVKGPSGICPQVRPRPVYVNRGECHPRLKRAAHPAVKLEDKPRRTLAPTARRHGPHTTNRAAELHHKGKLTVHPVQDMQAASHLRLAGANHGIHCTHSNALVLGSLKM